MNICLIDSVIMDHLTDCEKNIIAFAFEIFNEVFETIEEGTIVLDQNQSYLFKLPME